MTKHRDEPQPQGKTAKDQERRGEVPGKGEDVKLPAPKHEAEADADAPAGAPVSSGGKAWRPGDPTPMPGPTQIEQPAAPPLDATREGAGDWSAPPPGQEPPEARSPGVPRYDDPDRLPRVIRPDLRAAPGQTRYKIRADVPGETNRTLYVLAKKGDQEGAVKEYARVCKLTGTKNKLDAAGKIVESNREFDFVIKELAD